MGGVTLDPSEQDERVRAEICVHDDIVVLSVQEGYRMNSQKGLLFLEWVAKHSVAEFLVKADDDVYLRPAPLLDQLRLRPPVGYAWGFFDYFFGSPRLSSLAAEVVVGGSRRRSSSLAAEMVATD